MKYLTLALFCVISASACRTSTNSISALTDRNSTNEFLNKFSGAFSIVRDDGSLFHDDVADIVRKDYDGSPELNRGGWAYLKDGILKVRFSAGSLSVGQWFDLNAAPEIDIHLGSTGSGFMSAREPVTTIDKVVKKTKRDGNRLIESVTVYKHKKYYGYSAAPRYLSYKTGIKFNDEDFAFSHRNSFVVELTDEGFIYRQLHDFARQESGEGWTFRFRRIGTPQEAFGVWNRIADANENN